MAHYINARHDHEAYAGYRSLRRFFNKLWVHEACDTLGRFPAFPSGIDCPQTGIYAVRPVMNLSGMGAGSYITLIRRGECNKVLPGYFATPYTDADHYSVGYKHRDGCWQSWEAYHGVQDPIDIKRILNEHKVPVPRFVRWECCTWKAGYPKDPPSIISTIDGSKPHLPGYINVEYRGDLVVEVHLRSAPRIERSGDVLIPVYRSNRHIINQKRKYKDFVFRELYDDADGFLPDPRLGFLVWRDPQDGECAE